MTTIAEKLHPIARRLPCLGESNTSERAVSMSTSALFSGFSSEECAQIASFARTRVFGRDELLFMQGQPAQNFILIQSGSVKLTQLSATGNEVILWMRGQGELLGVYSDPACRTCIHNCSAHAVMPCTALIWDCASISSLLQRYPNIRTNITHIFSRRLEEMEERFREMATECVAKRLALALLRLMKQVGRPHAEGTEVSLSREEMAQLIGTTLFTISRIISKWNETGMVLARREAVIVCNAKHLQNHADSEYGNQADWRA